MCYGVRVCVVNGGSSTCECPSGYVDDDSGGCKSVPGMFIVLQVVKHRLLLCHE